MRDFADYRLPRGRHGIPRELIAENQRWRLLGAVAETLAERGYAGVTATAIARCAHVSRGTFYEQFGSVADCLSMAFEVAAGGLVELASAACEEKAGWPRQLDRAVEEAVAFFVAEPALATLLGPEAAAGLPAIAGGQAQFVDRLAELLRKGRLSESEVAVVPASSERHLVLGALGLATARLRAGDAAVLSELASALAQMIAEPYGRAAAQG